MSNKRFLLLSDIQYSLKLSPVEMSCLVNRFGSHPIEVNYENMGEGLLIVVRLIDFTNFLDNDSDKDEYIEEVRNPNHSISQSIHCFVRLYNNQGKMSLVDKIVRSVND